MSDKTKNRAGESGLDQSTLERLAAELQAELDDLYASRRRRAIERASMTEEEQIAAMTADLEAVLADALENGMDIVTIPEDEDEEG